jgi:hypothetical protein
LHETFKNHPGKGKRMAVLEDLLKRDSEERRFDLSCKLIGRVSLKPGQFELRGEWGEGEAFGGKVLFGGLMVKAP